MSPGVTSEPFSAIGSDTDLALSYARLDVERMVD